jgi:DNA processing protein
MDNYLIDCLRIFRTPQVGPVTYNLLKEKYKESPSMIDALKFNGINVISREKAMEEINYHKNNNIYLVEKDMDLYPNRLKPYSKLFPIVSIQGNIKLLDNCTVGIVGARQCSIVGKEYTKILTKKIRQKYTTVSGLAIGIDTIVAENSLSNHIGVVPSGINIVYPPSNKHLYQTILDNGGCLISCQPWNMEAKKTLFPIRNQLIAALSDGLIITEAKLKSGSLQTAQFILDYNKPLLAVAGHPLDDNYSGNNWLLQNPQVISFNENLNLESIFYKNLFISDNHWNGITNSIDIQKNYEGLKKEIMAMVSLVPLDINHLSHYLNYSIGSIVSCCIQLELEEKIIMDYWMKITKKIEYNHYDESL